MNETGSRAPLFTLLYCCFTQLLLLLYSTLRTLFRVTSGARACPLTSAPPSRHFCLLYSTLLYSAALLQAREPAPRPLLPHATSAATSECFTPLYSALHCFTLLYSALLCFTLLYSVLLCVIPALLLLYSVLLCFTLLYSVLPCFLLCCRTAGQTGTSSTPPTSAPPTATTPLSPPLLVEPD